MNRILLIDDNHKRFKIVKQALFSKEERNASEPIFEDKKFEVYPIENESEEFCKAIREMSFIDLYFKIYKYIEENEIDILLTDLTFKSSEKVGESSGEKLIEKLLSNNLHSNLPIIAYSRKSENQLELSETIRAKITYVPVGTEISDVVEIRRKFKQEKIKQGLIEDKIKDYKDNKFVFDLAIICALNKEYDAVIEVLGQQNWFYRDKKTKISYWENKEKEIILKVAIRSMDNNMGMVEATLQSLEFVNSVKPKLIAMTGIAGGAKQNGAYLGDVCLAKTVDNWQSGKYFDSEERGSRFELSPDIQTVSKNIQDIIEKLIREKNNDNINYANAIVNEITSQYNKSHKKNSVKKLILDEIKKDKKSIDKLNDEETKQAMIRNKDRLPKFQFGEMMTGSSLVADEKIIEENMLNRNRKALFFDMEGYAIAKVAHTKGIDWIIIKSVVDYGNNKKGNDWHDYACMASARVLYQLSFDILNKD